MMSTCLAPACWELSTNSSIAVAVDRYPLLRTLLTKISELTSGILYFFAWSSATALRCRSISGVAVDVIVMEWGGSRFSGGR